MISRPLAAAAARESRLRPTRPPRFPRTPSPRASRMVRSWIELLPESHRTTSSASRRSPARLLDGVPFHPRLRGFMAQTGHPTGTPRRAVRPSRTFRAEFNDTAARAPSPSPWPPHHGPKPRELAVLHPLKAQRPISTSNTSYTRCFGRRGWTGMDQRRCASRPGQTCAKNGGRERNPDRIVRARIAAGTG